MTATDTETFSINHPHSFLGYGLLFIVSHFLCVLLQPLPNCFFVCLPAPAPFPLNPNFSFHSTKVVRHKMSLKTLCGMKVITLIIFMSKLMMILYVSNDLHAYITLYSCLHLHNNNNYTLPNDNNDPPPLVSFSPKFSPTEFDEKVGWCNALDGERRCCTRQTLSKWKPCRCRLPSLAFLSLLLLCEFSSFNITHDHDNNDDSRTI